MVSERDRIVELSEYLSSLGVNINIGKNRARGHKGIFMRNGSEYRIDVSKSIDKNDCLSVMLHEFAHFVHYSYDKTLKSLDFAFGELSDELQEELIKITVQEVPKNFASNLFNIKQNLQSQIKNFSDEIRKFDKNFKLSCPDKKIEKEIPYPIKYLLKYDKVKFMNKIYDIENLDNDYDLSQEKKLYILIKSKQRALKRINSKINRINKYYNNPSELFARFVDFYYTNPEYTRTTAPVACARFRESNIDFFKKIDTIFS